MGLKRVLAGRYLARQGARQRRAGSRNLLGRFPARCSGEDITQQLFFYGVRRDECRGNKYRQCRVKMLVN